MVAWRSSSVELVWWIVRVEGARRQEGASMMELKTTATNDDKGKNKEATLLTTLGWGTERKRESKSHRLKLGGWKRVNCEQGGRVWKMIHAMARSMGNVEVWDSLRARMIKRKTVPCAQD
ncbi:MAG: hypothetical protein JOS17DRAFT_745231, partial [Linnemannia elongata]